MQHASLEQEAFQDMTALTLDAGLFTSEFRLCDTIAEYLANIVAQSHEDPARYANFSSLVINEIIELAFRSAEPVGRIDIDLLKSETRVRACVAFEFGKDSHTTWATFDRAAASSRPHPVYDLAALAQAVGVDLFVETGGDDRVTLIADFLLREGTR